MELTYHWEGDVLIPDLELEDGSNYQIGKYGRMRQRYLFKNQLVSNRLDDVQQIVETSGRSRYGMQ